MFFFFLNSYRKGLLTFGGEKIDIIFDINGPNGKETIRRYENGQYKTIPIITRHPNIVKSVITGKKSWGLHIRMWSEGIQEWLFTKEEILSDFVTKNITIPKSFKNDFDNWIKKHLKKRYENI